MNERDRAVAELYGALGYKPLSRGWAKTEILLGLLAAGIGILVGNWSMVHGTPKEQLLLPAAGLVMFVLGAYLAMAGHRSHLYQSNNELVAYLVQQLQRKENKVPPQ